MNDKPVKCPRCKGLGKDSTGLIHCSGCRGKGKVISLTESQARPLIPGSYPGLKREGYEVTTMMQAPLGIMVMIFPDLPTGTPEDSPI